MSGRKLTRRQQWRAEKIQQERQSRASKQDLSVERALQGGELGIERLGLVISRYSKEFEIQSIDSTEPSALFRCLARTNLGGIVAGDEVIWQASASGGGIIVARNPRKNLLERPDNFGRLKPVAANVDQMIIVISPSPAPQAALVDRYLVAAELLNMKAVVALNKVDLLRQSESHWIRELLGIYRSLDYATAQISCARNQTPNVAELEALISNTTSIVVGQSGVGKSSLINSLLPSAKTRTGALSTSSGEGTHTTTRATLFHLECGGALIDSPGIRDFALWHINARELQRGFPEIERAAAQCKFRDCQHLSEPNCAVRTAVETGDISHQRFDSFELTRKLIQEQNDRGLGTSY